MSNTNDIDLDAIEAEYEAIDWEGDYEMAAAWGAGHGDALLARVRELAARVAELEAIVAKLPKTADGVPVVPDGEYFQLNRRGDGTTWWTGEGDRVVAVMAGYTGDYYDPHGQDWDEFYSTREAALAAAQPTNKETGRE